MSVINNKFFTGFLVALMIGALPPLLTMSSEIKSFSSGTLACSIICILICLDKLKNILTLKKIFAYGFGVIVFYLLAQHLLIGAWQAKSYISILPLCINILAAYLISLKVKKIDNKTLLSICHYTFYLMIFLGLVNISTSYAIGKNLGYSHGQPMFPFLEPSHYALFLGPFTFIYSVTNRSWNKRLISLAIVTMISFMIPSTTLLTYAIITSLALILTLKTTAAFLAFPVIIISASIGVNTVMSNEYFTSRLTFSSDTTNTTALVYLQGLQDTQNSLELTNGLGLGFQMLGTQPPSTYAFMIAKVMGNVNGELNREDGGFLAAKIISEFGYLGIYLMFAYLLYCFKCVITTRRILIKHRANDNITPLICYGIITTFSVELFVRGVGYFSPGVFIFLIAFFYLLNKKSQPYLQKNQLIPKAGFLQTKAHY